MEYLGHASNFLASVIQPLQAGSQTQLTFVLNGINNNQVIRPRHARISVESAGGTGVRWGLNADALIGQLTSSTPPNNIISFEDPNTDYSGVLQQISFYAIGGPVNLQINYYT